MRSLSAGCRRGLRRARMSGRRIRHWPPGQIGTGKFHHGPSVALSPVAVNEVVVPDIQVELPELVCCFGEPVTDVIGPSTVPEATSMPTPGEREVVTSEPHVGGDVG